MSKEVNDLGTALKRVPEDLRSPELCLAAVQQAEQARSDDTALKRVPENLRSPELCLEAVQYEAAIDGFRGRLASFQAAVRSTPDEQVHPGITRP